MSFSFPIKAPDRLPDPIRAAKMRALRRRAQVAFTLVELLVSTAVFAIVLVTAMSILGQATSIWKRAGGTVEAFQSARTGYDIVTRTLSQATLNTYVDYLDAASKWQRDYAPVTAGSYATDTTSTFSPVRYARQSDLQFLIGPSAGTPPGGGDAMPGKANTGTAVFFQAPVGNTSDPTSFGGLDTLLNAVGYYVDFSSESPPLRPDVQKFRYRLMQLMVPAEQNRVFDLPLEADNTKWATNSTYYNPGGYAYPVAENVIALIVRPIDPSVLLSNGALDNTKKPNISYYYNSRLGARTLESGAQPITANQMPPTLKVTMVAIDEPSAIHLDAGPIQPPVITAALTGKFTDPSNYDADMKDLEAQLTEHHINYRVFESTVPVRESRWSKN